MNETRNCVCEYCGKPFSTIYPTKKYCRPQCSRSKYIKKYYKANPEKRKERDRKKNLRKKEWLKRYFSTKHGLAKKDQYRYKCQYKQRYGLELEDFALMLEFQNGLCAICGNPETTIRLKTGEPMRISVDHDHVTGKVRGLLCRNCNKGIGCFAEDPEVMRKAIAYLELHKSESVNGAS